MPTTAKGTPYVVSTDLVANYPTVSSDLADHIDDNLAYNAVTINAQTGTTYTFALTDASEGKLVTASNAAASTYTVPPQSSITWASGSILRIVNQGAGVVTLVGGSGVTLNGGPLTLIQYEAAQIYRTASNVWTVVNNGSSGLVKVVDSGFSAVANVSINNCFSSTYENYRVVVHAIGSGAATALQLRWRASGADQAGTLYWDGQAGWKTSNVAADFAARLQAQHHIGYMAGSVKVTASFDVITAQSSGDVTINGVSNHYDTGSEYQSNVLGGRRTTAAAADGFTLIAVAGTMTGHVRVYGYRN